MKLREIATKLYAPFHAAALRRSPPAQVLWSKGYALLCDVRGPQGYWLDRTESRQSETFFRDHYTGASGLVWVRLGTLSRDKVPSDLDLFVQAVLPTIGRPFVLITTDGDASVPSDLSPRTVERLLECPFLVSWHTQNYDGFDHPKLAPIPIGIDLHTPHGFSGAHRALAALRHISRGRVPAKQMPPRVFCDLGVSLSSETRRQAVAQLRDCDHVDFLSRRIARTAVWRRYAAYPFVLSAEGNGLDSHRTWELLYLGCIVITKKSSLDPLFEGLPVVTVDDWRKVRGMSNLQSWQERYGPLAVPQRIWERLRPQTYLDPIRRALASRAPTPLGHSSRNATR